MKREEAIEVVRKNLPHLGIGATEMTDALGTLIPEFGKAGSDKVIDHEDKYKEALLEARAVLEPCLKYSKGKVREALDSIDKELKSFESEDERIMKTIRQLLETARDAHSNTSLAQPYIDALAWLEKQKEQKPAEWSEEDEEMLDAMVDMVANSLYEPLCPRDKMYYWLKSLRPQYHGDVTMTEAYKMGLEAGKASSWKPSEEQMKQLHYALTPGSAFDCDILNELYTQLNELM